MISPVHGQPALLVEEKTLIIADLHIGIEHELRSKGLNIPSRTEKVSESIIELCIENSVEKVVLLGDIKHTVPQTSWQELREIPELFRALLDVCKVHVGVGNHDSNLEKLAPRDVKFHPASGFVLDEVGFFHGHSWPSKDVMSCKRVVMAHVHASITFIDELGARHSEQCWLRGGFFKEKVRDRYGDSLPELIIMPAFNTLCGGTPLNALRAKDEFLGPLLRNNFVNLDNARIYLLDGTFLGELRALRGLK